MGTNDFSLDRRSLLAGTAATLAGATLSSTASATPTDTEALSTGEGTIPPLEFYFSAGLLNEDGEPLTDNDMVAVTAEPTTEFRDARAYWKFNPNNKGYVEDGVWTGYPEDTDIPLVAIDDDSVEGAVVGMGSLMVQDGTTWSQGNAQFMINLFDDLTRDIEEEATVLFHEFENPNPAAGSSRSYNPRNHQYYDLEKFSKFREYAAENGYEIISDDTGDSLPADSSTVRGESPDQADFVATLVARNPEIVWIPAPDEFTEPALQALEDYVARGGVVLLQDCSDFIVEEWDRTNGYARGTVDDPGGAVDWVRRYPRGESEGSILDAYNEGREKENETDPSGHLNEIVEHLGIGFRFNDGIAVDRRHNAGDGSGFAQVPLTGQFNTDRFPELFGDRPGIEPNGLPYRFSGVVSRVIDGDTFKITLDPAPTPGIEGDIVTVESGSLGPYEVGHELEIRVLGIDSPEDGGGDEVFERPTEWEGIAYEPPNAIPTITKIQFDTACSLLDADSNRLTDDGRVAVRAEQTATTEDAAGDGAVDYGDTPIPLVATGDDIVGIGSLLVDDDADAPERRASVPTYEFLQNVWDAHLGGGATVLYDESHGQPATLDDHSGFVDDCDFSEEEKANNTGDRSHNARDDPHATYDIIATDDLLGDLEAADALWLTPPETPFTKQERDRLRQFVADGGVVFLHGRGDNSSGANTDTLNEVAAAIGAPFRFNSDHVVDSENNVGGDDEGATSDDGEGDPNKPLAGRFSDRNDHPYFLLRQCDANSDIGPGGYPSSYGPGGGLSGTGSDATDFCRDAVGSRKVVLELDPNAPIIGGLGRLYGYTYLESEYPDGEPYGQKAIRAGYARVYDSGHTLHDEYLATEIEARNDGRVVWENSDPAGSPPLRNRPVEHLYLPQAASVRTTGGQLPASRAPVLAETTARQDGDPSVDYGGDIPLAGVDSGANTALIGAPLLAENYDIREDDYKSVSFVTDVDPFRVNTAGFENFTFLANLINQLSDKNDGTVYIDGGHGQFGGSVDRFGGNYTLSAEDSRYFERFLEGVGINCEGIGDIAANLTGGTLPEARAIVISTPKRRFEEAELDALREFQRDGGAVILLGTAEAPGDQPTYLNRIADSLGTDLRLNDDQIRDTTANLKGLARLPTTTTINSDAVDEQVFEATPVEEWTGPAPSTGGGGGGDPPEPPEMSASGARTDDGSVFTRGQTDKMDVTIESIADPVKQVTVTDSVPDGWTVAEYGDAQNSGDVEEVELGTVTREELEKANGGVTRTYFAEASTDTGQYTFGPATATATATEEELKSDSAEFGGTDSNTVVGVSSETSDSTDGGSSEPSGSVSGDR